ncbi:MAG: response regulator [Candidatus Marinimicrobia bacterium]|nr:response regulator [Candidatus Neomarinimicrobiota bacterium]
MEYLESVADKYKFIFDKTFDQIALVDMDLYIVEANRSATVVFGMGLSIQGKKCYEIFHRRESPCVDCPLFASYETGKVVSITFYDEKIGEHFEERTYPITDDNGLLVGFIIVTRNVTTTLEIENKSYLAKKLIALGQISSGVAHDFNNVLTGVLGRIQLLKRTVKDKNLLKQINMIEKSALDGASKVAKIQEFSRTRKSKEFKTINLKELVTDVIEMTRPKWKELADKKGMIIEPVIEMSDEIHVIGDESDLRNAFTNIIFNAVDAMPEGGIIEIRAEDFNNIVKIYIRDTGVGMSDEVKEKIFDPFFTTKGHAGTGLGMSEVYGIIRSHNGMIEIESEVGKGTTIILTLPTGKKTEREKIVKEEKVETIPLNVMAIDDEEYILEVIRDILLEFGHNVATFQNPKEAIEEFKNEQYDVVLTDLGMPVMSGFDVARKIKSINKNTTVILLTGWNIKEEDDKKVTDYADYVLRKPFSIDNLVSVISESSRKVVQRIREKSEKKSKNKSASTTDNHTG